MHVRVAASIPVIGANNVARNRRAAIAVKVWFKTLEMRNMTLSVCAPKRSLHLPV